MSIWRLISYTLALFFSQIHLNAFPHIHLHHSKQERLENKNFLVIMVDARHLDYTNNRFLLRSVAKHPSDGSKNGDVGHAWIYLQGIVDGDLIYIEGGHSGEQGILKPKYFEGVMNYIEYGVSNPRLLPCNEICYEPNPIKYLWEPLNDGFFQPGSGGHHPTYAAKIELTPQQFLKVYHFIKSYPYDNYALTGNQCSSFVAEVADHVGIELDCEITIPIQSKLLVSGRWLQLWQDGDYGELTIASPDILETSLMKAVKEQKAQEALKWYKETHPISWKAKISKIMETVARFPERYARYLSL